MESKQLAALEAKIEALEKNSERMEKQFNEDIDRLEKRLIEALGRTDKQYADGFTRLEQRMDTLERKQEAGAVEVARQFVKHSEQASSQFAKSNEQLIEVQTRMKALTEKVDTSHAQSFSMSQSILQQNTDIAKQLDESNKWMRTFIDTDKADEKQTKVTLMGWIGAIGTAIAGASALVWAYLTKK